MIAERKETGFRARQRAKKAAKAAARGERPS